MFGQGSPRADPVFPAIVRRKTHVIDPFWSIALAVCAMCCLGGLDSSSALASDEVSLRLRIAWGGGAPHSWQGRISLDKGKLGEIAPLGMEADVPGSMQSNENAVQIARRGSRVFDGVDVLVTGQRNARLKIELTSDRPKALPERIELTLASTIDEVQSTPLDDQGNRLIVRRAPGDKLRVPIDRDSLIFAPHEKFEFTVVPYLASLPPDAALRCQVQLLKARTETEIWSQDFETQSDPEGSATAVGPISLELPALEGVYDVLISLYPKRTAPSLVRARPLAQRKVQLLVFDDNLPPAAPTPADWKVELDLDPANPKWWDRVKGMAQLKLVPGLGAVPANNGKSHRHEHRGQSCVQLDVGGWQSYPLSISRVGEPHVLEVEYPSDVSQTLGISIVEPNAAGALTSLGLDSGFDIAEAVGSPGVERHKLVFWPKTKTPLVMFTNRRADGRAQFGKLRVLSGPTELPPAFPTKPAESERLFAAYFDKPLFPENFGASEALDPSTNRSLDDWETFYQGGRRFVSYLKHAGYNGAMVSVACEGSTIYPSKLLQPTPKYDSGMFFATGQDPVRKDVLQMLHLMFDRAGLRLVPAIGFSTPLPEIEAQRVEGELPLGIELVDFGGQNWLDRHGAARGLAPYYNPLDVRVRRHMVDVAAELAERYGHHPSFAGLAIQLGPESYAQLPGEAWGADDETLARFSSQSGVNIAQIPKKRGTKPEAMLTADSRQAWLAWRSQEVTALHAQLLEAITAERPGAKLYLAGAELFTGKELQAALRPTLPARDNVSEALLQVGLVAEHFLKHPDIVLLRPRRFSPTATLASQNTNLALRQSSAADRLFGAADAPGSLFFQEPLPLRLTGTDDAGSPGAQNSALWLVNSATPAGARNRERFVHALAATDSLSFIDGGWMLSLGQEDPLRALIEAYRALPAEKFATVIGKATGGRTQPVVVRTLEHEGRTFFYLVNDSPWPVSVECELEAASDCQVDSLERRRFDPLVRRGRQTRWTVSLEPFDLVAGVCSSPDTRFVTWQVTLPREAKTHLELAVQQVRARASVLKNPLPLPFLENGGFESAARSKGLAGWLRADDPGLSIALDRTQRRGGEQSLVMRSKGPNAWVRSEPFEPPSSGRLSVWVWLRVADATKQPPLRLAVEGRLGQDVYYKFAHVGAGVDAARLDARWAPYLFQVDDLPTSDLTDLRIGFDLMGAGEVWLDDVQLFDAWFYDNERDELAKSIALADADLAAGRIADCRRFLDGYWPKFLLAHVRTDAPRVAVKTRDGGSLEKEVKSPAARPTLFDRLKSPLKKAPPKTGAE